MQTNIQPEYEVETLEGTVVEKQIKRVDGRNVETDVEVPAGYMVFFPRGHSMRVRNDAELARLGFDNPANLIDTESGEVVGPAPRSLKQRISRKAGRADTEAVDANVGD